MLNVLSVDGLLFATHRPRRPFAIPAPAMGGASTWPVTPRVYPHPPFPTNGAYAGRAYLTKTTYDHALPPAPPRATPVREWRAVNVRNPGNTFEFELLTTVGGGVYTACGETRVVGVESLAVAMRTAAALFQGWVKQGYVQKHIEFAPTGVFSEADHNQVMDRARA